MMWWKGSNSYKQARPQHLVRGLQIHLQPCIPFLLMPVEKWGKILMLIFLPVLIRPLMGCSPCRNCQTFLRLFTKPTFNWGRKKM